jgi:polyvinyl alcohol dehydrogenase (cytochrome)
VPVSSTVAVAADLVVAGDLGGFLHALDRATGEHRWSTDLNPLGASLFASPVVIEDSVIIGTLDTELGPDHPDFRADVVAVDVEDGSERWRLHTDPDGDSGYWVPVWSTAAYDPDRGLLYVGTGNTNQPSAVGPGSGAERAPIDLPLADGVLAIDHDTGEMAWFFKLVEEDKRRDFDVGASPNLFTIEGRDVVGVGGKSGEYVVLDRDTGEQVWKATLTNGSALGGVMSTAAIGDGVIYVASNQAGSAGTVFALDAATGSILWQESFGPPIVGSMALANGVLYRGTFSPAPGTVMAIDAADGTVLWDDEVGGRLGGGFSVVDGSLYVGYGSGGPPALEPEPGGLIAYRLPGSAGGA